MAVVFSGRRDRIDLVGIEGEQFLDREHLVVRLLVVQTAFSGPFTIV